MKEYLYTFIIPHKNCPDLLKRCVDSIPERDDIQIIVVDDNSDDDKKPSLPAREGLAIVHLDADQSKGAGRARNVGLKYAKGKWLLFADADDYYSPGFIEILDEYINQQIDVLYYCFEYKDGRSGALLSGLPYIDYINRFDGSQYALDQIKYRIKVPWNKMVRREFVKGRSILFEETINGNDIFFSLSVGYFAKTVHVEKRPVYVYLKNENSLVNTISKETKPYLCKIRHKIQLNQFYNNLGYPEWISPVSRFIIICIKRCGPKLIISLLGELRNIKRYKNNWVQFFNNEK